MKYNANVAEPKAEKSPAKSQFSIQSSILSERMELLEKMIADLAERLSPVLRAVPTSEKEPEKPEETLVEVADRLRHFANRLEVVCSDVQNIIQRIEV